MNLSTRRLTALLAGLVLAFAFGCERPTAPNRTDDATSGATQGVTSGGGLARVYVGAYGSRQQAAAKMRALQQQGIPAAVTTR